MQIFSKILAHFSNNNQGKHVWDKIFAPKELLDEFNVTRVYAVRKNSFLCLHVCNELNIREEYNCDKIKNFFFIILHLGVHHIAIW